jgi:imidazolonepropionase-like amidohydrolase
MDEQEAWKAVTINPAKVLGIDDQFGSLEVGKVGNIAVFEGNPLRDIQAKAKYVLVDGKVVVNQ